MWALQEKVSFLKDISSNKNLKTNLPFYLLTLIDKIDDLEKAKIIAFISRKMVYRRISSEVVVAVRYWL